MKNKILTIIFTALLLLTIISITACNSQSVDASNNYKNMFTRVYTDTDFYVIYDNETKVMYTVSDGLYNRGTLTMLVNADGTPKLYSGE